MPDSPDIAANVMTGMQVGNNIWKAHADANAKNQMYENQLAQYALRAQQMQHENTMRQGYFDLATLKQQNEVARVQADQKWREFKEQEDTADKDRNYKRLMWGETIKAQKADEFIQRKQNEATGVAGFNADLSDLAGQESSPTYDRDVLNRASKWAPYAPAAVQNIAQNRLNAANVVRDHAQRANETDLKDFYEDIGRKLGGGNTLTQNLNWVENYEKLPDKMEGGIYGFGAHKTTQKQVIDPNTGNVLAEPDIAYLESLRNQYHSILARKNNIGAPINRPDIGVYSPVPLPSDRSQWQVGHSYYSPVNGQPAQWTGTQFIPLGQGSPHPQPDDSSSDSSSYPTPPP